MSAIDGVRCVHPVEIGCDEPPWFRLVAGDGGTWVLDGEIDYADAPHLATAVRAVVGSGPAEIDVSGVSYIGAAGITAIAMAAAGSPHPLSLVGASEVLRRSWRLVDADELAPGVTFA